MATTLAAVRQYLGPLMGEFVTGTPAAGGTTTVFTCAALAGRYKLDKFNGRFGRFYAGTLAGTSFRIDDYTATTASFTIVPAMGSSVAAADLFEIFPMGYEAEGFDSAINLAIQSVETVASTPVYNETIVAHDVLTDGRLEIWTSGTELTNWTEGGSGTLTTETGVIREGSNSAKMIYGGATDCTLSQSIANPMLYAGSSFVFRAQCATVTADIARIRITDGTTTWNSAYHGGEGWLGTASQGYLEVSGTLGASPTELTASLRVDGAGTVYWDKAWLDIGPKIYEYTVPSDISYISKIIQEDKVVGHFNETNGLVDPNGWRLISDGTTPKIVFDPVFAPLKAGRILQIVGQFKAATMSSDTATTEINPAYLAWQAKAYLHAARITDDSASSKQHGKQMAVAEQMASRYKPSFPPAGRKVHW